MDEDMKQIRFTIPGQPFGKQRPKFSRAEAYVKTYTPKETTSYENLVKLFYNEAAKGKREAEEAEREAAEAKKAQEAAAEVEQTEPQSEMGKVIESIEKSAFAQAVAGETQAAPAAQVVDPFAPKEEPEQEKKYRVRFFADGTKEQLGKLIAFMNENNIKYGKIAKESK